MSTSGSPLSGFLGSNDLTDKIKQSMGIIKEKTKENKENYSEDLEDFILRNSKELVECGIEAISEIKQTVLLNPQSDEVEALGRDIQRSFWCNEYFERYSNCKNENQYIQRNKANGY